ncbi:GerMN domain-containing protein [Candidatus Falkowbacteria bacterium]|nr:GerMN domain-containing protein [Candidatus Falkowbacteria bacterium]
MRNKKFLLPAVAALALFILAGCQNLGESLKGKYKAGGDATAPAVNSDATPASDAVAAPAQSAVNNIFFGATKYDPEGKNCYGVYWVHIPGDTAMNPVERNIKLLLAGPTENWAAQGYFSNIPQGVRLNSVKIEGDLVTLDFSEELNKIAGSCAVTQARQQIIATAQSAVTEHLAEYAGKNVEDIKVVVSINGNTAEVLQP